MKKIMLAAAIICVAAISQGAAVTWQGTATSAYSGQTMYLLTAIASTYESVDAFKAAAVDSAAVVRVGPTYKISQRTAENAAITGSSSFYFAVLSADEKTVTYLDVTSSIQSYIYTPPDSAPGTFTVAFADVAGSSATAAVVPEPTSGLLMLVGLAGLALRRRRA